jgi:hypothetical protein
MKLNIKDIELIKEATQCAIEIEELLKSVNDNINKNDEWPNV